VADLANQLLGHFTKFGDYRTNRWNIDIGCEKYLDTVSLPDLLTCEFHP